MSEGAPARPVRLRVELHAHTNASPDSRLRPATIIRVCQARGIEALAITDHNTMDGAFAVAAAAPFPIILGDEIKSRAGDIIGLFLKGPVPRDLSPRETVHAIKAQGGLVLVPHPFDSLRRSALGLAAVESIVDGIDILEVFNGRTIRAADNAAARHYAERHGLAQSVGSDSHLLAEIGVSWQRMRPWSDPADFLLSLRDAELHMRHAPAWVHLGSSFHAYATKFEKRLRRWFG
ncbi:MAG: PHP domain-containing protein [Actinobacteria bacterium]|nr:PHP domain-containing protein [Actinomycetota bacterium]